MVRSLSGVKAHVRFEVPLFVESLATVLERANEVSYPLVFLKMHLKSALSAVGLIAPWVSTCEHFVFFVSLHVVF
jgi:hypothetical protein